MNNPAKDALKEAQRMMRLGFDYLELTLEWPRATVQELDERMGALEEVLSSSNAFLVVHAPWYLEIASPYEGVREGALSEAEKIISLASALGSRLATFHPFCPGWLSFMREKARELNASAFLRLVRLGEEFGVKINFENTDTGAFSSVSAVNFVFDRVKGLDLTLDVGHAYLGGGDEKMRSYFRHLEDRITHVHAHDNFGSRDLHLPVGAGRIDWTLVSGLLKFIDYGETITMEPHSGDTDYLAYSRDKFLEYWERSRAEEP